MPLRKDIQKFNVALKVFCNFSTESERLRIQSSLYLVTLVSDINKGIKAYLDDIEKGECKKVLGVDFKRLTQREYWLKNNKLRNDPLLTKNTPLKDFGINYEFDGCPIECTKNIVNILEEGIDEMIRLLKEAKKKTLFLLITFLVPANLRHPELPVRLRNLAAHRTLNHIFHLTSDIFLPWQSHVMPMPEASIHKDTRPVFPQHQVRMPRQPLMVQSVTESPTPQPTTHNHLRLCILRPNRYHVPMALLWGEFIHTLTYYEISL